MELIVHSCQEVNTRDNNVTVLCLNIVCESLLLQYPPILYIKANYIIAI